MRFPLVAAVAVAVLCRGAFAGDYSKGYYSDPEVTGYSQTRESNAAKIWGYVAAYSSGNKAAGKRGITEVLLSDPGMAAAHLAMAEIAFIAGDLRTARKMYEKGLSLILP